MTRRARADTGSNEAKRTKLATNASDCASYEMLVDPEYPVELAAENLQRALAYEGQAGMQELLALIARSIGCVDVEITTLEALDDVCIPIAPINYPMQRRDYANRVSDTLKEVIYSSESNEVAGSVTKALEYLTQSSLRSLRHCATQLLAACDQGNPYLADRASDAVAAIRELAVGACLDFKVVERNLNDTVAAGRLAAVRALQAPEAQVENWSRLVEMSKNDVDIRVRRESCRLVARHAPVADAQKVLGLVEDIDVGVRRAAAVACWRLMNIQPDTKQLGMNPHINKVLWIADKVKPRSLEAAAAIADATRGNISVSDVSDSIMTDIAAKNRRLAGLQTANYDSLLVLLHGYAVSERTHANKTKTHRDSSVRLGVDLLSLIPRLCERMLHNDALLAKAVAVTSAVDIYGVLRAGLEKPVETLMITLDAVFTEHPVPEVLEACSDVFKEIPEDLRRAPLQAMLSEVRIQLATALGPPGSQSDIADNDIQPHIMQILVLSRFISIAEVATLPVWGIKEIVRTIGLQAAFNGEEKLVKKCVAELDAESALEVLIVARLKDVEVSELSRPQVGTGQVSSRVWLAAVAAGVV